MRDELDAIRRDIEKSGARIAYDALKDVARDKTAPAQARATAATAILRLAGVTKPKAAAIDKDLSEMTTSEINARQAWLMSDINELKAAIAEGREARLTTYNEHQQDGDGDEQEHDGESEGGLFD